MKITTVSNLIKFMLQDHKYYQFRGQRESNWKLESTIERTFRQNPLFHSKKSQAEHLIIGNFKRSAHLYDKEFHNYNKTDLSVLTYIQHHGAPTRLLDFTASKFIALFFAFDDLDKLNKNRFVRLWYFDSRELMSKTADLTGYGASDLLANNDVWENCIAENKYDVIFHLRPDINSQRSHIQKGSFICTGNIYTPMHDIFTTTYDGIIRFIDIHKSLQKEVFELLTQMNISHRTLYGGIDGYAKDVKNGFGLMSI